MNSNLRLNLGCGEDHRADYVNVDKFGKPDILHDLEIFPWPWDDNSVIEVVLKHVLEHLGEKTMIYLDIFKELYRVCKPEAEIEITVPHPRHDDFIDDPTHVRAITPSGLTLFSKSKNNEWIRNRRSNTPLGIYLDIDFEIIRVHNIIDPVWSEVFQGKDDMFISQAIKRYNNVVREIQIRLKVMK